MSNTEQEDARFVQQARELAEYHKKTMAEFLPKGHKEVARLHELMKQHRFEVEQNQLLVNVPNELQSALRLIAWDYGHSAGYGEVLNYLTEMVDRLEKPLKELTERLTKKGGKKS